MPKNTIVLPVFVDLDPGVLLSLCGQVKEGMSSTPRTGFCKKIHKHMQEHHPNLYKDAYLDADAGEVYLLAMYVHFTGLAPDE